MIESIAILVIWIVVLGVIYYVLMDLAKEAPAPFQKVAVVLIKIAAVLILLALLLHFLPPFPAAADFRRH